MTDIGLTQAVDVLVGAFIPIFVGVLTKSHEPEWVKAVLNALCSAVTGVAATLVINHDNWKLFAVNVGITWVVSIATHYGLYKPTGATNVVQLKAGRTAKKTTHKAA